MKKELSDSEILVMNCVWAEPGRVGRDIAATMAQKCNWASGATYTLLGRCERKGAVRKDENGRFYPLITKKEVQMERLQVLHSVLFDNSFASMLCGFSSFATQQGLTAQTLAELEKMITKLEQCE